MADTFDPYSEWLGIEGGRRPPDHYRLLGLKRFESDPESIARAADAALAQVRRVRPGAHLAQWSQLLDHINAEQGVLAGSTESEGLRRAFVEAVVAPLPNWPPRPGRSPKAGRAGLRGAVGQRRLMAELTRLKSSRCPLPLRLRRHPAWGRSSSGWRRWRSSPGAYSSTRCTNDRRRSPGLRLPSTRSLDRPDHRPRCRARPSAAPTAGAAAAAAQPAARLSRRSPAQPAPQKPSLPRKQNPRRAPRGC